MTRKPKLNRVAFFASVGYQPHPGQLKVHASEAPRRILACGVRWGKTTCAAMEALAAAMDFAEHSRGWLVAPNYELSSRGFREVRRIVETYLPHHVLSLKPNARRMALRNLAGGVSEIVAKSAEKPDALLGEGLDWLIVDEAARLKPEIWNCYLSQRLVDRRGWALIASTPQEKDWFYELYQRGQGQDPDFESWRRPSLDNPLLDEGTIDAERARLSPATFAREYEARFIDGDVVPCEGCEFPRRDGSELHFVYRDEPEHRCPKCGELVGDDGRSVGRMDADGEVYLKVIVMPSRRIEVASGLAEPGDG